MTLAKSVYINIGLCHVQSSVFLAVGACVCVCVCACVPVFTKLCQHTNSKNKHTLTLTHLISFGPARSSQLAFDSRGRISSNGPEHLVYRLGKAGSVPNARTIWLLGHRLSCTQLLVNTMSRQARWFINKTHHEASAMKKIVCQDEQKAYLRDLCFHLQPHNFRTKRSRQPAQTR